MEGIEAKKGKSFRRARKGDVYILLKSPVMSKKL